MNTRLMVVWMLSAVILVGCGGQTQTPDDIPPTLPSDDGSASPSGESGMSGGPAGEASGADEGAPTEAEPPGDAQAEPTEFLPEYGQSFEGTPRPVGQIDVFAIPSSRPHDVAPAPDGTVWYTGQRSGEMGLLDPRSGETVIIPLPGASSPHGVIVGPDGAAWITDGGANSIVRIDGETYEVTSYPLPADRANANLNTAAFDGNGVLWFTGQNGIYGSLNPATGEMVVYDAPRGRGPYGITGTPGGDIYYASLAGSYVGKIDINTGEATVLEPPTPDQGARRVWSDSTGHIWVSEWNAGQVAVYDPVTGDWQEWRLPGDNPQAYAVYVDDRDIVWLTDFGGNALVSFDPTTEEFTVYPLPGPDAQLRQLLGRPGEVWAPASGLDEIYVLYTTP